MGAVCAPVAVVTVMSEDQQPYGATVSSFGSLSLIPPLVNVSFDRQSAVLDRILHAKRFGVNVLGHTQDDLAALFATRGVDRFAETPWDVDSGVPCIRATPAFLACDLDKVVEAGDHLLLFGLVTKLRQSIDQPPLVYAYRTFGTHSRYADRPRKPIIDHVSAFKKD